MFKKIKYYILKRIYKLLIFRIVLLDKTSVKHYDVLETFCEIDLKTDKGIFKFQFKKDRRKRRNSREKIPSINTYLIELIVPETIVPKTDLLKNKIVVVVKVALFNVDYKILTELLMDLYLNEILKNINSY